jgi:hypothetical protein
MSKDKLKTLHSSGRLNAWQADFQLTKEEAIWTNQQLFVLVR